MICNQAFCKLTGYTEEELRNMACDTDLTPPEWWNKDAAQIGELNRTGQPSSFTKEYIRRDGSRIQVELYRQLVRDGEGNVCYYNTFINEVSGRDVKKLPWEGQRAHFTMMGNLPGIVYQCANDRDWTMKSIAGSCYELTGYHPSDLIDSKVLAWNQLIHQDDRERVWDVAKLAFEEGGPFQQEYRITTADGALKWVWEQCRGLVTCRGDQVIEGFITDVTERKLAEEQIKDTLEGRDAIIKDASDINNEVVSSLLQLRSLLKNKPGPETGEELEKCIRAAMKMQSKLYESNTSTEIDFAGYTQLAQDVEFIFDGRQYLYLR
jgi:PAS domain S-box-containing protein